MKKSTLFLKTVSVLLALCMLASIPFFASAQDPEPEVALKIHAQTLELESNVYVNYYVRSENVADLTQIELQIWTDATGENAITPVNTETPTCTLKPVSTSAKLAEEDEETYVKFSFRELAAKQMTDTVYARAHVRIGDTDYYSDVQKYSILQYAYNKLGYTDAPKTDDENLIPLLESLLAYGAAAQTYFQYTTDRLANDAYRQISVSGGVLASDACTSGLYLPGEELTLTAVSPNEERTFVGWMKNGTPGLMTTEKTLTVEMGDENASDTAIWATNTVISVSEGSATVCENVIVSGNETDAITATGGTVTVNGGYYDGGNTPLGDAGNTAVWANGGDVVINDGYFTVGALAEGDEGHIDLIYAKTGVITINGGFFVGEDETVWLLNCHDGNYKNGDTNIIVKGGTFVNFDPSNNASEGAGTSFVADGYTVVTSVKDNGDVWYSVVAEN